MRILMVCLGNICRSPLAEGILRHKLEGEDLDWVVDSAGTGSWHIGEKPDPRSIAIARKNMININGQRARKFKAADFSEFDVILTMDDSNYRDVTALARSEEEKQKVKNILDFHKNPQLKEVPDPYWNDDGFEQVFEMLTEAVEGFVAANRKP